MSDSTEAPPGPATRVHSLRCTDAEWDAIRERAAAAGTSINAYVVTAAAAPSVSTALGTLSVLQDFGGVQSILDLAESPRLARWDRAGLRDLSKQLAVLAGRWPR